MLRQQNIRFELNEDNIKEKEQLRTEKAAENRKNDKRTMIMIFTVILLVIAAAAAFDLSCSRIDFEAKAEEINVEVGGDNRLPVKAFCKSALFGRKKFELPVSYSGDADFSHIGTYKLECTVSYERESKSRNFTVHVVDTTPPEIVLKSSGNWFTSPGHEYNEEGFTATDNYDGDITDKVTKTEKDGKVIYTVSDSSGNTAKAERKIEYKDVVAPVINLNGGETIKIKVGQAYKEQGCTATDDCDGDLTNNVQVSGSVDTSKKGEYTVTYTVSDSNGNQGTAKRKVVVYKKFGDCLDPGDKTVYLTFDDGPGKYTEKLLNVLDKYDAKATFFVTNQYPEYQNMIGEEARRGHTVAIHTYSHNYSKVYASEKAYFDDLNQMSAICKEQIGYEPFLVRFPGGTSNTVSRNYCNGIMSKLSKEVEDRGYLYCDWNVSSGDAGQTQSTDLVVKNVINGIKHTRVSVVLQHDVHGFSVDAVEQILAWGTQNGYRFIALDEESPMVHHRINN